MVGVLLWVEFVVLFRFSFLLRRRSCAKGWWWRLFCGPRRCRPESETTDGGRIRTPVTVRSKTQSPYPLGRATPTSTSYVQQYDDDRRNDDIVYMRYDESTTRTRSCNELLICTCRITSGPIDTTIHHIMVSAGRTNIILYLDRDDVAERSSRL